MHGFTNLESTRHKDKIKSLVSPKNPEANPPPWRLNLNGSEINLNLNLNLNPMFVAPAVDMPFWPPFAMVGKRFVKNTSNCRIKLNTGLFIDLS
jgi:hypothetical protein